MQRIFAEHATRSLLLTNSTHPGPIKYQREHLACAKHGIKFRRTPNYLAYLLPIDSVEHRLRKDLDILTPNSHASHVVWVISDYHSLIAAAESRTGWEDQAGRMFKEQADNSSRF